MGRSDSLRTDTHLREEGPTQRARLQGAVLSAASTLRRPGHRLSDPLWEGERGAASDPVLGVGQISLDRVWHAPGAAFDAPEPDGLPFQPGGQVATAMLALARLGLDAAYAGAVGDDAAGRAALAPLEAAGVDCSAVDRVAGGRTRHALVKVREQDGERFVHPDRDPRVWRRATPALRRLAGEARAVLIDAEDPGASLAVAAEARRAGRPVVLDVDAPCAALDALLAHTDFPIVPRALADFLGRGSTRKGLAVLAARAGRAAVVTLGEGGAMAALRGGRDVVHMPAFRVDVRDTTGAGDAFHAGFLVALLDGASLSQALRTANAVAARNCEAIGAQGGLPDRAGLARFLASAPAQHEGATR